MRSRLRRPSGESTDCQGRARCRAHDASISERRACSLVGLPRATMRYQLRPSLTDVELTERIMILAHERRRFGYRRIYRMLRREGIMVNRKRVYRLYKEAGLAVRIRKQRKGVMVDYSPLVRPEQANQTWSMDFVMDALGSGRQIKCLTIVDDFTKECLDIPVGYGLSGEQVTRTLDTVAMFRGYPAAVRTDQGPEFTSKALDQWAYEHGVELETHPTRQAYSKWLYQELQWKIQG